tara:strand:- start:598 stop:1473 length:876 start_codon:yes stop_codon:yes gene_type:complete
MVKLRQGSNVLESELNSYFDYNNNFTQLVEDYLLSGEIERKFNKSQTQNKGRFISNQRTYLNKLYKDREDIKPLKKWMNDTYESKVAHMERNQPAMPTMKIDNKDKLIEELQNKITKLTKRNSKLKKKISKLENKEQVCESVYESPSAPAPIVQAKENAPLPRSSDPKTPKTLKTPLPDEKSDKEHREEFIENKKVEDNKNKKLKDNAYQMEINYLNSFDNCLKKDFHSLVEEYSEGEVDIEEVKEDMTLVYELKLDQLNKDPLVNITRLRNKTKNHIEDLIHKLENDLTD